MSEPLSRDEFLTHVSLLREDVQAVHARLDVLNGRTRAVETEVAVLKDRATDARSAGRNWGAGAGAAVGGALSLLMQLFGGGK